MVVGQQQPVGDPSVISPRARSTSVMYHAAGLADRQLVGFSQIETCWRLSLVKVPVSTRPTARAVAACKLGHQVEFCRPHVPERVRVVLATAIDDLDVVRTHRLRGDVVKVERPSRRVHTERRDILPSRKPSQIRDHDLDDETAAGCQVSRGRGSRPPAPPASSDS
jgi:hypothetical protein